MRYDHHCTYAHGIAVLKLYIVLAPQSFAVWRLRMYPVLSACDGTSRQMGHCPSQPQQGTFNVTKSTDEQWAAQYFWQWLLLISWLLTSSTYWSTFRELEDLSNVQQSYTVKASGVHYHPKSLQDTGSRPLHKLLCTIVPWFLYR